MRYAQSSRADRRANRRSKKLPTRQPANQRDWSRAKLAVVGVCFALLWLGLWARAFHVQIIDGQRLAQMASLQHLASESITGRRGEILDRNGAILAKSVVFKSVFTRPLNVQDPAATARKLAGILDLKPADVLRKLTAKESFVWISRKVCDRVASEIRTAKLPGVYLSNEYGRQYPNRHLAGQLLGFVGMDDEGLEGLEKSFNEHLAGGVSKFLVHRDASGHKLYFDAEGNEVAVQGKDLQLTIDSQLQFAAEEILARTAKKHNARWAGALLVEVLSGEILAWAQYPFFNPNDYSRYNASHWRNRLAVDAFEPGSTMKPFLVAAALQESVVTPATTFDCESGRFMVGRFPVRDVHPYGVLPVHKIIRYSSNIGVSKIGFQLGARRYHENLTRFGFGSRTGLPLPGESTGTLRSPGEWRKIDMAAASFGQSISVTMAQMAQAYLSLADQGLRKPLVLVKGQNKGPQQRILDPAVAHQVLSMLTEVVEEDGTGRGVRIEGLPMAGKTGTAQKASKNGGYGDKYMASFVGMLPATRPEYLIIVVVDEPEPHHYGAVVAAPVFKELAVSTLAYSGGLPVEALPLLTQEGANANASQRIVADLARVENTSAHADHAERVPDLVGRSVRKAMEVLMGLGIVPSFRGQGMVVARQSPNPGSPWPQQADPGVVLWLESGYDS